MKRKNKWVFWGYLSLDYKAIQIYLEDMALKGWMLVKVNRGFAKFKAATPSQLRFCVDVFSKGGPLTPENTIEAKAYRERCEKMGWKFITSLDYLQFFYADRSDEITPIQTDEVLEQKIVASTLWKNELLGLILFIIIAGFSTILHFPVNYRNLLNNVGLLGTYVFPVLYMIVILSSGFNLSWMYRMRRSVKNGNSLGMPNLRAAKQRAVAINSPMLIIVVLFITGLLLDAMVKPQAVLGAMFPPVLGVIVGLCLRFMIKKRATEKKDSILYIVIAFFVIVAVSGMFGSSSQSYSEEGHNKIAAIPIDYPMIDFGQVEKDSQIIRSGFDSGKSPAVPIHYNYWENRTVDGDEISISVSYYRARSSGLADTIFTGIKKELEKGIKWRGRYYFSKDMRRDEALRASWEVDDLSISDERDEIVLRKGVVVLRLYGELDFSDDKTRDLVLVFMERTTE